MNNVEAHRSLATITAVAKHLALDMASMEEAPAGKISKYSTYVIGMRAPPTPRVGRCAVVGWGPSQEKQLLQSAKEAAREVPGAFATAVISRHPSPASPEVEVSVFCGPNQASIRFPCVFKVVPFEYEESEEQANARISETAVKWVEQFAQEPRRKKFLGLF